MAKKFSELRANMSPEAQSRAAARATDPSSATVDDGNLARKHQMSRKQVIAQVTDTNHVARGPMIINVDFDHEGPINLVHDGGTYHYTGKSGVNIASGQPAREMATDRSARLWITLDASSIWED